jgi:hypothetical protein
MSGSVSNNRYKLKISRIDMSPGGMKKLSGSTRKPGTIKVYIIMQHYAEE